MRNRPNSALVQRADGSKALECGAEKLKKNHSKKKKGKRFLLPPLVAFCCASTGSIVARKTVASGAHEWLLQIIPLLRCQSSVSPPSGAKYIFPAFMEHTHTNQPTMLIAAIVLPPFVRKKISTIDSHGFGALFKIIVSTRMVRRAVDHIESINVRNVPFIFSKIIVWPVCIAGDSFAPDRPDYLIGDTFPAIHYFFDLQTWGEVYQISFSHSTFSANGFSLYNGSDSYQFRSLLLITWKEPLSFIFFF